MNLKFCIADAFFLIRNIGLNSHFIMYHYLSITSPLEFFSLYGFGLQNQLFQSNVRQTLLDRR